jgi:hypothetical protein
MTASLFSLRGANVNWPGTIKLNVLRAFAAGIVWGVVSLMTGGGSVFNLVLMPIIFAVGYVGAIPMFHIAGKLMSTVAGDIGTLGVNLASLMFAFGIAVGDPLLYLVYKKWPLLLPVEEFRPVNFTMTLFVLNP